MTTWYNLAPQPNWQEWLGVTVSANPSEFVFSADSLTNIITVSAGSNYFTGKAVMVSSTTTLPSPLNNSSVYYIIFLSSTSYKLATTYNNALAGTAIDLTTSGTGVLTIISTGVVYLQPNANGQIFTYSSLDHSARKATYTDWTGNTENTNPIILDDKGMATIYWKVNSLVPDDNYYIEIYTADSVLLYSRDNFNAPPGLDSGGSVTTSNPINLLINNEFDFWGMYDYGIDAVSVVTADCSAINLAFATETAYNWMFFKSNNNATDILTRQLFSAGQTDVPNTPVYYMRAACTNAGLGGETFKNIYQSITNVQNFAGETINFSFYAKSSSNGTIITPYVNQYFGSGGSTAVLTEGTDVVLTNAWALYSATIIVPSLSGKSVTTGSNVQIGWEMPINTTYQVDIANTQLVVSPVVLPYRQLSYDERFSLLSSAHQEPTGTIKIQSFGTVQDSWIPFTSGTVGNALSGATVANNTYTKSLFTALWTTYNDAICPVYDDTGAKVVRGASAAADFSDNRQIEVFFNSGRSIANAGTQQVKFTYTVTVDPTNTLTINGDSLYANRSLYTGSAVGLLTTGTAPTGLATATTYYVIVINAATGTYKLATNFTNALAGTAVVITSVGTGIQTVYTAAGTTAEWQPYVSGQAVGESSHFQLTGELAAHNHSSTAFDSSSSPVQNGFAGAPSATNPIAKFSTTTGSNTAMNITDPTLALPHIIKL